MASQDLQILIHVDLYPGVSLDDLKAALPDERDDRKIFSLTEYGAKHLPPPTDDGSPIDWPMLGKAVEKIIEGVRELQANRAKSIVLFVGGNGPLAVFVHLGYLLSNLGSQQVFLGRRAGTGPLEHFPMAAAAESEQAIFALPEGLPSTPAYSSGFVGIYVDTQGRDTPDDMFGDFLDAEGEDVGGILKLRTPKQVVVTPENLATIADELVRFFSKAPSLFPKRSGVAIFVGGPAQVAFAVGRALNPTVIGKNIWLTNYRDRAYEHCYSLPFVASTEAPIPQDPDSRLARRTVLDAMDAAIQDLREFLKPEYLPTGILPEKDREKFIQEMGLLKLSKESKKDEPFELRVIEGRYQLGEGILQAFIGSTQQEQADFAKLVLLHEMLHDWQRLRSTNYESIGRACFVLEQIDYAADVFALGAIMNMELDQDGPRAHKEVSRRLTRWIGMVLHGIRAFDMVEQGSKMDRLPERRLRRYLLWHLQLARAATVRKAADVAELLNASLTIELAPLLGRIDTERFDKVVLRAVPETELFIDINGYLVRANKRFDLGRLVDDIRNHRQDAVQSLMVKVVDEHRDVLARWVGRDA